MLKLLGLDSAEVAPLRPALLTQTPGADQVRIADVVREQIAAEQNLSASRLTWNLTFQGFTIAGYALVATADASAPARTVVQSLIALVSIVIAFATLRGLVASQRQRAYLKRVWKENGLSSYYPEPFADSLGSALGRAPSTWMCLVLIAMWLFLIPASLVLSGDEQRPTKVEVVGIHR